MPIRFTRLKANTQQTVGATVVINECDDEWASVFPCQIMLNKICCGYNTNRKIGSITKFG